MKKDLNDFIKSIEDDKKRADAEILLNLIEQVSGYESYLTGSMIGFGKYHYKYESGREGDWFVTGFSPRKKNLVVYIMPGFSKYQALLDHLGKFKTGKSCLYINKLSDINLDILKQLVKASVDDMQGKYNC